MNVSTLKWATTIFQVAPERSTMQLSQYGAKRTRVQTSIAAVMRIMMAGQRCLGVGKVRSTRMALKSWLFAVWAFVQISCGTARVPVVMGGYPVGCVAEECVLEIDSDVTIRRTLVDVEAYESCVRAGSCSEIDLRDSDNPREAVQVTFEQAVKFCAWEGGRVPSSSEWLVAARGKHLRRYGISDAWDPSIVVRPYQPRSGESKSTYRIVGSRGDLKSESGMEDVLGPGPEYAADKGEVSFVGCRSLPTRNYKMETECDLSKGAKPPSADHASFRCVYPGADWK